MKKLKIGTQGWWTGEFRYGSHGIVHAIMKLVWDRRITPKNGVEMIEQLVKADRGDIPEAPWGDVRW